MATRFSVLLQTAFYIVGCNISPCFSKHTEISEMLTLQWDKCQIDTSSVIFADLTLEQCVKQCWSRTGCKSISYNKRIALCALIASDGNDTLLQICQGFVYTEKSQWKKFPSDVCDLSTCPPLQTCDLTIGTCSFQECEAPPHVDGSRILGNRVNVGSSIKYKCTNRLETSVTACQDNGKWDIIPVCIQKTIGQSCKSYHDCREENSQCNSYICFCKLFHRYDPVRKNCVQVCSSFGNDWKIIPERYIRGYNRRSLVGNVTHCQEACLEMGNNCINFEYYFWSNRCFMNMFSTQQIRDANPIREGKARYTILYERNCVSV